MSVLIQPGLKATAVMPLPLRSTARLLTTMLAAAIAATAAASIGDQVLIALATRIGGMIRETDKFGRYGGEEFLLLMPATPIDLGLSTVERIREDIAAAPWSEIATGIHLTISCGVTEIKPTDTTSDVITRADQALYEAKHKGRNRVCSI